ncbi:aminoglycoside phosphotransferase family protein [Tolypothrix sp. FACHB-123]|uniref:aminoglycoside phosphotransferase family protein n=1 Tax=Tolypothrix sp. FACHB-123 TaxID=2692868 RepID=UPI001689F61A|nr:aminoglycoside phosphotransferase family protein [Tolypothrix sp. FACHB-123]MBD2355079.1 aminoglycoside phosphotransferase family protein [Tolypothrix sp. FACHB-123]
MAAMVNRFNVQAAVQTVCEVAEQQFIKFDTAIILADRSNLLVHLSPSPVVARVATTTGTVRQGDTWLKREIAIASHLAIACAPVIPSSTVITLRLYHHNGLVLTFWEFVQELADPAEPTAVGRALRDCHSALIDFDDDLPIFDALSESEQIFAQLSSQGVFSPADAEMLQQANASIKTQFQQLQLPMQPIHGDSNFSNVLNTTQGVLWADWEDTFIAPIFWDLACLIAPSRVFGEHVEQADAALKSYGINIDTQVLDIFIEARAFQTILWNYVMGQQHPESWKRFEGRLQWFRQRQG